MEDDFDNCLAEQEQDKYISADSGDVLQPGQRIDSYRIIRRLGSGGMGKVYEAEHVALRTRRALKVFSTESKHREFLRKRFIKEGCMLADLKHPRIVRVYDLVVDEDSGTAYFGMDLVLSPNGQPRTLADEQRDGVSEDKIVGWFKDICEGLAYIHSQGVVHRDISLDNILIGPDDRAVITDFGIAKIIDDSFRKRIDMTVTVVSKDGSELRMGKGLYMAPELKKIGKATFASDAYAVGVILYRLLMGSWYEPGANLDCLSNFEYGWQPIISQLCNVDPEKRLGEGGFAALPALLERKVLHVPFWRRKWVVLNGIAATLFVVSGISWLMSERSQSADTIRLYNELTSDEGSTSDVGKSDNKAESDNEAKSENTHGHFVRRKIVVNKAKELKYKFEIDKSTGNKSVTVVKARNFQGDFTIPAEIDGCKVTKIGMGAFSDCHGLNSVTIPVGVTDVGGGAFSRCTELMGVTIPVSVTNIGEMVFSGCRKLGVFIVVSSNLYYKSSSGLLLTKDGKTLIHGVNGDVTIPNGVIRIASEAFGGCSGLANVKIPDSVISIGEKAFDDDCKHVFDTNSISGVKLVDGWVIGHNYTNELLLSCDLDLTNVRGVGNKAFYGCTKLPSVIIGSCATSIGESAFFGCCSLTNVTISTGVTSIGDNAFSDCDVLKSMIIPHSVTNIGDGAFFNCSGLREILVDSGNTRYCSQGGLLLTKDGKTLITVPGRLEYATIPDGVTIIGKLAFHGCGWLTNVMMSTSLTSIGDETFEGCYRLKSIVIPEKVTSIGKWSFLNCSGMANVKIPASVTNINESAFLGCSSLGAFSVAEGNQYYTTESGLLLTKDGKTLIRGVNGDVKIPEGVMYIIYKAFDSCGGLTSVRIPRGVTCIGEDAFSGCTGLTSVTLPGSVTNIGSHAFSYCDKLASVTIDNGVTSIGDWAFERCRGLMRVTIPGSVTNIGYGAFMNRTSTEKHMFAETDLETVYVSAGDADRVKKLFWDSGHDITNINFVESEDDGS